MKPDFTISQFKRRPLSAAVLAGMVAMGFTVAGTESLMAVHAGDMRAENAANPCNPCAPKNPYNPCGAKNPCNPCAPKNPCNPCGAKNPCNPCAPKNPCNPCGAKNPCNPCGPKDPSGAGQVNPKLFTRPVGTRLYPRKHADLVAEGERLWNDPKLGASGSSCQTCHTGNMLFQASFTEPYPHRVAMPYQMAGVDKVSLDEMVQFCMVVPMASKPLPWESRELAALTAYSEGLQKEYMASVARNPCNPRAAKNPCNPCAPENPCNPCGAKNPCNPCAPKNPCNPRHPDTR